MQRFFLLPHGQFRDPRTIEYEYEPRWSRVEGAFPPPHDSYNLAVELNVVRDKTAAGTDELAFIPRPNFLVTDESPTGIYDNTSVRIKKSQHSGAVAAVYSVNETRDDCGRIHGLTVGSRR